MPIYAYRCETCGHAKDVLQKMSDPVLTTCPSCGAESFKKQLTAAGFQLKGSGWYVTDFRGGSGGAGAATTGGAAAASASGEAAASSGGSDTGSSSTSASSSSSSSDSGGSSGAAGCAGSCACH